MHVILDTEVLRTGLKRVLGVIARHTTLPVLACVRLCVEGDTLTITASDMEIEARNEIAVSEIKKSGSVCVDAAILSSIAAKTSAAQITLQVKDNRFHVTAEGSTCKLIFMPADDFPAMPDDLGTGFDLPADTLHHLLDSVSFCASDEETRYYLCGVYFHRSGGVLRTVATDGHRLALCEHEDDSNEFPPALLPSKTAGELLKLLDGAQIVNVAITENKARFRIGDVTLISKLIDGSFPDYTRVIPADGDKAFSIRASDLTAAIGRVLCVAEDKTRAIKFTLENETLTITAGSASGDATETLSVEYEGAPASIGFNGRYILAVLEKIKSKTRIVFSDAVAPAIFYDAATPGLKFVVMPMRV